MGNVQRIDIDSKQGEFRTGDMVTAEPSTEPATSWTSPINPAQIHSQIMRIPSPEWPWIPICVATWAWRAARASIRASYTLWVSGFWQ